LAVSTNSVRTEGLAGVESGIEVSQHESLPTQPFPLDPNDSDPGYFIAHYSGPETLASALAGVERLLLLPNSENGKRKVRHRHVIAAAKDP